MTHMGSCISAKGVRAVVDFSQRFHSTYLYGSYSPVDGDSFVWEIQGVSTQIFEAYLKAFSEHRPDELKIIVIDNAGFHSTKNIKIPDNIRLVNIPPYSPELNPCEQIWGYLKNRFKNKTFNNMEQLRDWLDENVKTMTLDRIKSITAHPKYITEFNTAFKN